MACLGADHRHIELDHLEPGNGAEDLFDRSHDVRQCRASLQSDALGYRMYEERLQIVEPLGEELSDRVEIERHATERSPIGWQRDLADLDLAARAPCDNPGCARARQPLNRVVGGAASCPGV